MNSDLKENISTLIEAEAEECPTVFAMFCANKEDTIKTIYDIAMKLPELSAQAAIYEMERRYGD